VDHNNCDVLIIGGGPAGLAAAIALRMRGADVIVADALKPPIDKACGEGLMPDSVRDLAAFGIPLTRRDGAPFFGVRFVNWKEAGTADVASEFAIGHGFGVRRTTLHMRLMQRAVELGVRLRWNTRVTLQKQVILNGEGCSYRYLIGTDGQSSRVRSWAHLDKGVVVSRRFGFRRHFRIASRSSFKPLVEVYWGDLGQAYVTPVSEDQICVATISSHSGVRMRQIIDAMPSLREQLKEAEPLNREHGAITTTCRLKKVVRGNVALLGDASGSVDAVTGEGLAISFRQAALLGQSIENGDLMEYATKHQSTLQLPQQMSRLMLWMGKHPLLRNRIMRMFAASPESFHQMLQVHLGKMTVPHFLLHHGAEIGWRLAYPLPKCI